MRALLRICVGIIALAAFVAAALSQPAIYPNRPIRLVVPYPAGGATDVVARIVAEKMSEDLGQQIYVDNRPGAGTMIGASAVARSAPDGYTILIGDTGTYALNPTLYGQQLTYDPIKDFAPVSRTGRVPLILVTNPKVIQVNSVKELIEAAKKEPGKIDYGAPGPGSPIHLAMELFRQRVGINVTPIPYKGGADALTDLLGGRVALLFVDAATGVTHIKSGALKALGVGTDRRIPAAPEVPTVTEAGVPDFEAWAWNGLAVPVGTRPEIIAKLNAACQHALAFPAVKQRLAELSVEPAPTSPDEFAAYIKSEIEKWRTVIIEAGISIK
jgi:tripartite-type tricarboxylate transporter receptor subunit TctC